MTQSGILLTVSPWYILLCLVIGVAYSWLLYSDKYPWPKVFNYSLAFLRMALTSALCFLLLAPLFKSATNHTELPTVIIGIDNSQSLKPYITDHFQTKIQHIQEQLETSGYNVLFESFKGSNSTAKEITFDNNSTNLTQLLSNINGLQQEKYITDVILISDGIINKGNSPAYFNFSSPVHTVLVGDTIPTSDLLIKGTQYNRTAFLANTFPLEIGVMAQKLEGRASALRIVHKGKTIAQKNFSITSDNFFDNISFQIPTTEKGLQQYSIVIDEVSGERNKHNNHQEIFIDVIDGKEKVLLLGLTPHPDIKALKSIIEANKNIELHTHVLTNNIPSSVINDKYDLVILHQLPTNSPESQTQIAPLLKNGTPVFYLVGNQTAITLLNNSASSIKINNPANQRDKTYALFNPNFTRFTLESSKAKILEKLPTMSVPYGNYTISNGAEIILLQNVGPTKNTRPLLLFQKKDATKEAILLGEGLWHWRMEEFAQTGKHEIIDEIIANTIQLLTNKDTHKRFHVTPTKSEYESEGEPVILQTELYNELYEKQYGQPIHLTVVNNKGVTNTYTYQTTKEKTAYEISNLPEGVYSYTATTEFEKKTHIAKGSFIVQKNETELINTTADAGLLREIAAKSGGQSFDFAQVNDLSEALTKKPHAGRITTSNELVELIHYKWLFFLFLLLMTLEWATRKYYGSR